MAREMYPSESDRLAAGTTSEPGEVSFFRANPGNPVRKGPSKPEKLQTFATGCKCLHQGGARHATEREFGVMQSARIRPVTHTGNLHSLQQVAKIISLDEFLHCVTIRRSRTSRDCLPRRQQGPCGQRGHIMKRIRIGNLATLVGMILLCLGIPAYGQYVTINFTGIANPSVQALGAYAGYYTGTVTANGVTTSSQPGFICDDYNNSIFLPNESWQATATSFASLVTPGGTPTSALNSVLFGNTIGISGYAAIAYLSNLMASTPATGQGDISAAIWYIGSIGTGTLSLSSLDSIAQGYVTSLLGTGSMFGAVGSVTSAAVNELETSSLWIYTPTGQNIVPSGYPFPQEFVGSVAVISVPEGGAAILYLLLALFACAGAIYFRQRKQIRIPRLLRPV